MYIKYNKTYNKTILINIILLLLAVFYGMYKNGLLLYQKNIVDFIYIIKPLVIFLINIFCGVLVNFIVKRKIEFNFDLLSVATLAIFVIPNINLYLYIIIVFFSYLISIFLSKYFNFNKIAFMYLLLAIILIILKDYNYANHLENSYLYTFSFGDLFFGRQISGISSSNFALAIFSYIILSVFTIYKKNICVSSYITYLFFTFVYIFITKTYDSLLFINSFMFYALIFVAPESNTSPYKKDGEILYGILIGITIFVLNRLMSMFLSVFISIFLVSLLTPVINNLKNYNKIKGNRD